MHIVEVRRDGGDVAEPMGRMRNWLDEHRIAPQLFTFTRLSSGSTNFCLGHWKNWVWVKAAAGLILTAPRSSADAYEKTAAGRSKATVSFAVSRRSAQTDQKLSKRQPGR